MVILQTKTKHIRPDLSRKPSLENAFAQLLLAGKVIWVHFKVLFYFYRFYIVLLFNIKYEYFNIFCCRPSSVHFQAPRKS